MVYVLIKIRTYIEVALFPDVLINEQKLHIVRKITELGIFFCSNKFRQRYAPDCSSINKTFPMGNNLCVDKYNSSEIRAKKIPKI